MEPPVSRRSDNFSYVKFGSLAVLALQLAAGVLIALFPLGMPIAGATLSAFTVPTQSPNPVVVGNTATYSITVTNSGGSARPVNVRITSGLPAGATSSATACQNINGNSSATFTLTVATTTSTAAGTYPITVRASRWATTCNTSENDGQNATGNLILSKANQTITVGTHATASATYNETFTVAATASSGLPVAISTSGGCTNVGNDITMTSGTTSCVVHYNQAGNASYNAAPALTDTTTALKKSLTASVTASDKSYDGTTAATIATCSLTGKVGADAVTCAAGAGAFDNRNAGVGKTVTASSITLAGAAAGNYSLSNVTATTTATITAKPITVTAVTDSKPYDNTTTSTATPSIAPGLAAGDTAGFTQSFDTKNTGTAKTLTPSGSVSDGHGGANYDVTFANNTTGVISARPITVTAADKTKVYGGADPALTYSITAGSLLPGDTLTGALDRDAGSDVAGYSITKGTLAANANYDLTFVPGTLSITPAPLTVTADNATKVYGEANPAFTVHYSSFVLGQDESVLGGSLSFTTPADATSPVTGYAVTPGGLTSTNYAITFMGGTLTVTRAPLSPVVTIQNKVYDGTTSATVATYGVTGRVGSDDVTTAGGTATFTDNKTVGDNKPVSVTGLYLAGTKADNYTLPVTTASATANITPATLTISSPVGVSRAYDGTTDATVNFSDDHLGGDTVTIGYTADFAHPNIGHAIDIAISNVTLSGLDAGNYTLGPVPTATTADITERPITVTADSLGKEYGAGDPPLTYAVTDGSLVSGESLEGALTRDVGEEIGSHWITQGTLAASANYAMTFVPGKLTIGTALLTATVTVDSKTYDGTTNGTILLRSLSPIFGTDDVSLVGGSALFSDENVEAGKTVTVTGLSLAGADKDKYVLKSSTVEAFAAITPKTITATVTVSPTRLYDGTMDATITGQSLEGAIVGDDVSLTGGVATYDSKDIGNGKTVTIAGMSLTGGDATNYTLASPIQTTANITAIVLTPSATADNKVYDGNTSAVTHVTLDNVLPGEDVAAAGTGNFSDKNVGTAKDVAVTGITLGGAQKGNYVLGSTEASAKADITPRSLTVTATGVNKTYDKTTPTTVTLHDNRIAPDDLTLSYAAANFDNPNVGIGKTVTVSGINITGGTDAGNYTVDPTVTTTANITPKAVGLSVTGPTKTYDGTTTASVSPTVTSVLDGDDVSLAPGYSAAFNNANVGAEKPVSISGLSLAGTSAGNYCVNGTASTSGDITPRALNVTADAKSKVYGDETPALTYTSEGLLESDHLTGSLSREAGETVGTHGILVGTLANPNYAITFHGANLTITPATLTLTADNASKHYGDADPGLTDVVTGLKNGDTVSIVSGHPTRVEGENVGTYAINQGTLTASANYTVHFVPATFTISTRAITVKADDKSKIAGDGEPEYTYAVTSGTLVEGDHLTGGLTRTPGGDLGTYAITQGTLTAGDNYTITFVPGTLTIKDHTNSGAGNRNGQSTGSSRGHGSNAPSVAPGAFGGSGNGSSAPSIAPGAFGGGPLNSQSFKPMQKSVICRIQRRMPLLSSSVLEQLIIRVSSRLHLTTTQLHAALADTALCK
jgi:hypothetical protein